MAFGWLKALLAGLAPRLDLDWVQVEITTRCNARCVYCPRSAPDAPPGRDMAPELFRSLLGQLGRTRHIHLQGWGEPLLHPRFFDMLAAGKARGLAVSTTTNGVLLDEDAATRLVELGLDVLGVSLAGVRPEANDAVRVGAGMERLLGAMERLAEAKARLGGGPAVHLAYLDRTGDAADLTDWAELPGLARRLGADKIMVSRPHPLATPAKAAAPEPDGWESACAELAARCAEAGLEAFWPARLREATGHACTENPGAACVIGVGGEVSPCVFTTPAAGQRAARMVLGDLNHDGLAQIWAAPDYARFRAAFDGARAADLPPACRACPLRGV
jgi:MoaA/NifB/PqqE/SkfB family radical SAM enzyme